MPQRCSVCLSGALAATALPPTTATRAGFARGFFLAPRGLPRAGYTIDLTAQLGEIEQVIRKLRARFLYIDPLVAGLPAGQVNSFCDQDVRAALAPVVGIAELYGVAVLGSGHFTKAALSALLGVGGSIGFVGLARSLLAFGTDPTDKRGSAGPARVLAHAKCNVGREQRSRAVTILEETVAVDCLRIKTSRTVMGDESDVTADELVGVPSTVMPARVLAEQFLRDLLADGPHAASEAYKLAGDAGISARTLKRAKRDLAVEAYQNGRAWWWKLDLGAADEPESDE